MLPAGASAVAEVGAGTGKLTGLLLGRGLAVTAVEPDAAMLDVVTVNRSEVRRVLRPNGCLSLIGNGPAAGDAWQQELEALSPDAAGGTQSDRQDDENPWADHGLAGMPYELRRFPWRERITPAALRARLATHSV